MGSHCCYINRCIYNPSQSTGFTMEQSRNATLLDAISAALPESEVYWQTVGGIQIVMAAVAVARNTLVGCTLLMNRQLRKNPNNILMANLAMADGLFAVVLFFIGYWNAIAGLYPFGELACRLHIVFAVSSSQASNNILAAMSVVKFIHVGFPFSSDTILQPVVIGAVCATCWLPPFVWNFAIAIFSIGQLELVVSICYPVYTDIVNILGLLGFCFVQFVTVVIATGLVLRIVRRHHKSTGVLTVGIAGTPSSAATNTGPQTSWKAVRIFVVIVTAFLVMQAPMYISNVLQTICQCLPYDLVYEYVTYLVDMNCIVNVLIYFLMEPRFRKAAI